MSTGARELSSTFSISEPWVVGVSTPEPGDGTLGVVVVERPCGQEPGRQERLDRRARRAAVCRGVPRGEHQVERERLVELLVVRVQAHHVGTTCCVGLGDQHDLPLGMLSLVGVDHAAPVAPHLVAFGPEGER